MAIDHEEFSKDPEFGTVQIPDVLSQLFYDNYMLSIKIASFQVNVVELAI